MEVKFNNPFIISLIIVIVLNLMVFLFFKPKAKSKIYFRSIFYMWVVTTGIFYYHHLKVEEEFKNKLNTGLNIGMINKPIVDELAPQLSPSKVGSDEINVFTEEALI